MMADFSDRITPEDPLPFNSNEVDMKSVNEAKRNLIEDLATPFNSKHDDSEATDKMKVYLRIRPFTEKEISTHDNQACVSVQGDVVTMLPPKESISFKNGKPAETYCFKFTQVHDQPTSQKVLFDMASLTTIRNFVGGQNCLIFSYGVTNSGKSYTVQGTIDNPGIIPRTMDVLFNSFAGKLEQSIRLKPQNFCDVLKLTNKQQAEEKQLKCSLMNQFSNIDPNNDTFINLKNSSSVICEGSFNKTAIDPSKRLIVDLENRIHDEATVSTDYDSNIVYSVWISFAEVYNENIYDLFEQIGNDGRTKLRLAEDRGGNIYIKGLREVCVQSADEACQLLCVGQQNLRIANTKLNHNSSRSHCIFSIRVIKTVDTDNPQLARISKLSFCDLAGSERTTKTQNTGIRLKEAGNINNSLMVLGRCIAALRHNQSHKDKMIVPFRDSKLTRLFQNFFNGKGHASMIVNISPSAALFDETIHALRFSAIAQEVVVAQQKMKPLPSKLSLVLNSVSDPRLTIAWEAGKASYCPSLAKSSEEDEENLDTETDTMDESYFNDYIEKMNEVINKLKNELRKALTDNANLETNLRRELAKEFNQLLVKVQNQHDLRLQETREQHEELMEHRMELMQNALNDTRKRARQESEDLHTDSIQENQKTIEELQSKNESLKKNLNALVLRADELQEKLTKSQFKVANLENELEKNTNAQQDITDEFTKEYEKMKSHLSLKELQMNEQNEMLREATNLVSSKDNEIKSLTDSLSESSSKIAEMKEILTMLQAEICDAKDVAEKSMLDDDIVPVTPPHSDTSILVQKLDSIGGGLFNLNKKAQSGLEKVKADLVRGSLEKSIVNTKSELAQLKRDLRAAEFKFGVAEKQIDDYKFELSKKSEAVLSSEACVARLLTSLEQVREEIAIKDSLIESKTNEIDSLGKLIEELSNETEKIKNEKSLIEKKFIDACGAIESAEVFNDKIAKESEKLNKLFVEANSKAETLQKKLEQLEGKFSVVSEKNNLTISSQSAEIVELRETVSSLSSHMSACQRNMEEKDRELKMLVEQKEALEKKEGTMKDEIEDLQVNFNEFSNSCQNVKKELEESRTENVSLRETIVNIAREVDSEQKLIDFADCETELRELFLSVQRRCNAANELNSELKAKDNLISKLNGELKSTIDDRGEKKNLKELTVAMEKLKDIELKKEELEITNKDLESKIDSIKIKVMDLLFSADNKHRQEFNSQDIDEILAAVKNSVLQLSDKLFSYMTEKERLENKSESEDLLEESKLRDAEVQLKLKEEQMLEMKNSLTHQNETVGRQTEIIDDLTKKYKNESNKFTDLKTDFDNQTKEMKLLFELLSEKEQLLKNPTNKNDEGNQEKDDESDLGNVQGRSLRKRRKKEKENSAPENVDESSPKKVQAKSCRKKGKKKKENIASEIELEYPFNSTRSNRRHRQCRTPVKTILSPSKDDNDNEDDFIEPSTSKLTVKKCEWKLHPRNNVQRLDCSPAVVTSEDKQDRSHSIVQRSLRRRK